MLYLLITDSERQNPSKPIHLTKGFNAIHSKSFRELHQEEHPWGWCCFVRAQHFSRLEEVLQLLSNVKIPPDWVVLHMTAVKERRNFAQNIAAFGNRFKGFNTKMITAGFLLTQYSFCSIFASFL